MSVVLLQRHDNVDMAAEPATGLLTHWGRVCFVPTESAKHTTVSHEITLSEGCGTVAAEISSSFAETLELSPVFPLKPGVDQIALHARLTPKTELRLSNFPVQ